MDPLAIETLRTGEVHVWLTDPAVARDADLMDAYRELMNEAERQKHDRYRLQKRRDESLLTRALVRTTLSRYCAGVEPAAWEFVEVGNGRPEIASGQAPVPLRFNLSRTDGLIACAVALERAIGVDVECIDTRRDTSAIVERYFAPSEQHDLLADSSGRFYSYWTLKESYVKARGVGLSIPLNQLAFHLGGPAAIGVRFGPAIEDIPGRWQFALERPSPRHVLALAVERRTDEDAQVRFRTVVPLRREASER